MEMTDGKKIAISFIKAVVTSAALTMDYGLVSDAESLSGFGNPETILGTLSKLLYAVEAPSLLSLLVIGFLMGLFWYLDKLEPLQGRLMAGVRLMALFAAFCTVTGRLFYIYDDIWLLTRGSMQLLKGVVVLLGLFLLFSELLQAAVSVYIQYCGSSRKQSEKIFDKKWIGAVIAAGILAAWFPTIVAYYPAVFMGDSEDIIYMAYNYPCGLEATVLPLKEGVYITNHHPVLYTAYVSLILHAVRALGGSWNFGVFLCAIIQCLFTVCVLAYSCMYCAKALKRGRLAIGAAVFYALFPIMPKYAVMISKDTFFADLLLLWAILIHKAVNTREIKKDMAALLVTSSAIVLIRKNGIYVMLLTLLLACLLYRSLWKRWFLAMLCIIVVNMLYSGVVLPMAGIPDGSVREMLSVPFQQTARYVKYHADEVTQEEKQAIAGVLDYDSLAQVYAGNLSDPVKNTYNKNAGGDELKNYLITWLLMFLKHPEEYAAAFLNNYYGYFYPVVNDGGKLARTSVGSMANVNRDGYFDFSHLYDSFHTGLRDMLAFYDLLWMRIPVLNIFMTSALYVWVAVAAFLLRCIRCDKAAVLACVMYLALLLTVLVGPSNAINYERYVFPCILGMPLLTALSFNEGKMKNGGNVSICDNTVL